MRMYSSDWLVDLKVYDKDGKLKDTGRPLILGSVPTMVRSCKCNLQGLDNIQLAWRGEDPRNPGGYFIINGSEYTLMYLEKFDIR